MASTHPRFPVERALLEDFCERWGVVELALFGSAARDEARPDSDYDLMVEFKADVPIGLWDFARMQEELAALTGKPVDLVEKGTIKNPIRRASVDRDILVVYRAA